ncbi:MAG TPA: hypothetical protein VNH40_07945, partial [Gaiellaceae bacterium]|nr:hypothetical protein [Gaiellaceae bacterium]
HTAWLRGGPIRRGLVRPVHRTAYGAHVAHHHPPHHVPSHHRHRVHHRTPYVYGYAGVGSPFRRRRGRPRPYHLHRYGYGTPRFRYGYAPRYAGVWDGTDGTSTVPTGYGVAPAAHASGTWARHGRNIVIYGVF